MKTRITELFAIQHPVVLSGMSWISVPDLVAAVARAGGLGILATGTLTAEQTRESVRHTRELVDGPFAANATLYFPGAERNAKILIEEQVPVINYSLGKGDWICEAVHAYGGTVIATVTTHKHALAAQRDGADALIVTGHEAAGHGGDIPSLVLVPSIVDAVEIPVIAAGGFADGRGLAAALALGAEGIAMGTRFMNTQESPIHHSMKDLSNQSTVYDTVRTAKVDGLPMRAADTPGVTWAKKLGRNPLNTFRNSREIARMTGFPFGKLALGIIASGPKTASMMARMANGFTAFKNGTNEGDSRHGVLPLGQTTGLVSDTPTVAELIDRLVAQAEATVCRMASENAGVATGKAPDRAPA
jgi:enoyl-[acyl-carrier protein] reductase II